MSIISETILKNELQFPKVDRNGTSLLVTSWKTINEISIFIHLLNFYIFYQNCIFINLFVLHEFLIQKTFSETLAIRARDIRCLVSLLSLPVLTTSTPK